MHGGVGIRLLWLIISINHKLIIIARCAEQCLTVLKKDEYIAKTFGCYFIIIDVVSAVASSMCKIYTYLQFYMRKYVYTVIYYLTLGVNCRRQRQSREYLRNLRISLLWPGSLLYRESIIMRKLITHDYWIAPWVTK